MKYAKRFLILLLCLCLLSLLLFGTTLLPARAMEGWVSYPSMMTEEQKAEYDKLIADLQVDKKHRKFFEDAYTEHVGQFEKITFGIDEYVLEYSLSGHFSGMEGDIEQTFFSELGHIERIYIPVYVQTSSAHRVIGHVVLKKTGDGYSHTPAFFKGTSDGSYVHFLERAGTLDALKAICNEQGLSNVTDVILVSLLDEGRDAAARISVVQTPDGRYVLDYGNAAYVEGAESAVYTFEEFSKIYSAYEKTRFPIETAGEIAEIVETTIDAVEWIMIIAAIAAGIAVFIGIGYHMHRKKRK